MKKLLFAIGLLLTYAATEAQTIHWLTFIDTTDRNVGEIDVTGRQVLYNHFINDINAALAPKGYASDIQDFYGQAVTPENCKSAIQRLRINNPDDIVVFYYIGHGERPTADANYMQHHPYPQMCMAQFDSNKNIPLEWVHKELSSKGARLSITIGMCCNVLRNISIKNEPTFSPNYGPTYMSSNKLEKIQELFLSEKGSVVATSSSPTQTSGCWNTTLGVIDRYTATLAVFFDSLDSYSGSLTWDNFLNNVQSFIHQNTNGEQTPIHTPHLVSAAAPKSSKPAVPTRQEIAQTQQQQTSNTTKQQGDDNAWINSLTDKLGTLINVDVAENDRIELEGSLSKLFAAGAQVRMLAQDADTVIDREDAETFLGRLATNRQLLKVVVVEGAFDTSNKIKSLKVREIYKK